MTSYMIIIGDWKKIVFDSDRSNWHCHSIAPLYGPLSLGGNHKLTCDSPLKNGGHTGAQWNDRVS